MRLGTQVHSRRRQGPWMPAARRGEPGSQGPLPTASQSGGSLGAEGGSDLVTDRPDGRTLPRGVGNIKPQPRKYDRQYREVVSFVAEFGESAGGFSSPAALRNPSDRKFPLTWLTSSELPPRDLAGRDRGADGRCPRGHARDFVAGLSLERYPVDLADVAASAAGLSDRGPSGRRA